MVHTRKPTVNSITNGSRDLVGRCAVFDTADQNQIVGFASYLIRVRVDPSKVLPRYLAYFLNSTKGRAEKLASELGHSLEHQFFLSLRNLKFALLALGNSRCLRGGRSNPLASAKGWGEAKIRGLDRPQ
jgi:hypothetical protein